MNYIKTIVLCIWLVPLHLMATISPEILLEKSVNKTLTEDNVVAYVKSRAEHRIRAWRQQDRTIPQYAQQRYACTNLSDMLVTSVVMFAEPGGTAGSSRGEPTMLPIQ